MKQTDVLIIGGGIVGLATAYDLMQRVPQTKTTVVEKEKSLAAHQTGHNSGVLHSGIYYKPGSLKATNCRAGKLAMERFCDEQGIPYELCGKVIVAVDESEVPALENIYQRGQANGVACEMIDRGRLHELEPHVAGVQAIHVFETGIVDYGQVCERFGKLLTDAGHAVLTNANVTRIEQRGERMVVQAGEHEIETRFLVNCAGLQCDRMTKLAGAQPVAKIVPFRGEYYELKPDKQHLCRNLIYPTPDPNYPFLGVHFTRMIQGGVECGPNAVLAFAREGYTLGKINLPDLMESLTYGGFLKMAAKHWRMGAGELWRSFSKQAFVKALRRLMPEIQEDDLHDAPAGVRAQAVLPDGSLVDDFVIVDHQRTIHINNAPSPAATASINIGKLVVDKLLAKMRHES